MMSLDDLRAIHLTGLTPDDPARSMRDVWDTLTLGRIYYGPQWGTGAAFYIKHAPAFTPHYQGKNAYSPTPSEIDPTPLTFLNVAAVNTGRSETQLP